VDKKKLPSTIYIYIYMTRAIFYYLLAIISSAVFVLAIMGIQIAAGEPVGAVFVYLSIFGIIGGLAGAITFAMQGQRAFKRGV
jgi:hypothetical protein